MSETPDSIVVLGIVKKLNKELDDMPLNTHIAVANCLLQLCQYRSATELEKRQKEAEAAEREKTFSPHLMTRPA